MTFRTVLILTNIFGVLILGSCKKSRQEKRIEGTWEVTSFVVNGIDSSEYVTYPDIRGYRFEYDESDKHDPDHAFHNLYEVKSNGTEAFFGHWGEREDDRMFLGVEYKQEKTGPFYSRHYYQYFDIEEIKRKEMKYTLREGNLFYEIEFEKI